MGWKHALMLAAFIVFTCFFHFSYKDPYAWADETPTYEVDPRIKIQIDRLKDPDLFVRSEAISALRRIGPAAVSALIEALNYQDERVRFAAAEALGKIGPEAKAAVPALIEALNYQDERVRFAAAEALGKIGPEAKAAVSALIEALNYQDKTLLIAAAGALGEIGPEAKAAVPALIEALKYQDESVRSAAAGALGKIGPEAKAAVPALIEALKYRDESVRFAAAGALGKIGPEAKDAVPALIEALKYRDKSVRSAAAEALGSIGPEAVPDLIEALKDPDINVCRGAVEALGKIGPAAKAALPALIEVLKDNEGFVSNKVAEALLKIAKDLRAARKTDIIEELQSAAAIMRADPDDNIKELGQDLEQVVDHLRLIKKEQDWWREAIRSLFSYMGQHPIGCFLIALYVLSTVFCLLTYWLKPDKMLRINDWLRPLDYKLPDWLGGITLSLRYLLIVGFLNYLTRVLDAWVDKNISTCRENFLENRTVHDRRIHIDVPVVLNNQTIPHITPGVLRKTFARPPGCLLIWGEGGSGKTSFACQIANWAMAEDHETRLCEHPMLPVLIEYEIDSAKDRNGLVDAIGGQLQNLTGAAECIPNQLLEYLLRYRRILVIVDHLSEMSEATRAQIRPERADFQAKALIVTSRLEETLGGVPKTTMKPLRIKGNQLSSFMEAYLTHKGKRDQFDDSEFFHACGRLSLMVGDRDITILLAKLYAEQMIAVKEGHRENGLPENIPDLMLSYLNELNRAVIENKVDDLSVHRDAKVLAWGCLSKTFRPVHIGWDRALSLLGGVAPESRLKYLEDRLRLVETVLPGKDRVRFLLDPLAEYLAGLHLIDLHGENEDAWRNFFKEADSKPGAPDNIKGFLLALKDCCRAYGEEAKVPDFVLQELTARAQ